MLFIATYSFLREIILDNEFISSFKIHKDMDSVEKRNFLLPIHSTILLFGKQAEIYNNFPGKNQMWHREEAKVVAVKSIYNYYGSVPDRSKAIFWKVGTFPICWVTFD